MSNFRIKHVAPKPVPQGNRLTVDKPSRGANASRTQIGPIPALIKSQRSGERATERDAEWILLTNLKTPKNAYVDLNDSPRLGQFIDLKV